MSWASDWVGVGEVGVCGNEIEWRHETVTSFVYVRAGLDCDIRDSYSFLAAGASLTSDKSLTFLCWLSDRRGVAHCREFRS